MLIEALGATSAGVPIELRIAGVVEHDSYWSHCQQLQEAAMAANPHLA